MTNLLPGNHAEVVINYIEDIIQQLQTNPNVLPVVSTPGLDSRGQHSQESHARSPSASRRHRDDPEARVSRAVQYKPLAFYFTFYTFIPCIIQYIVGIFDTTILQQAAVSQHH